MPMIGARFYTQLDALQCQCDMQEDELAKELENGRLYRLLVKLGCINERPEYLPIFFIHYLVCIEKFAILILLLYPFKSPSTE